MGRVGWSLILIAAAWGGRSTPPELVREVANPYQGSQLTAAERPRAVHATRVLDAVTLAPVAGARLYALREPSHSLPRLPAPEITATSDAEGWAFLHDGGAWYCVEADGYAPRIVYDELEEVTYVRRARDLEVCLLDWRGRPARGAFVSWFLGCGHTPDWRQATTDADGRAVLRGIDPSEGYLWALGENLTAWELELHGMLPAGGPLALLGQPGVVVEGRVLDPGGRPLAGAFVGSTGWKHGPWVRTDGSGAFRLMGVDPWERLSVDRFEGEYLPGVGFHAPPPGVRVIYRWPGPAPSETRRIACEVTEPDGSPLEEEVDLLAWRDRDGFTEREATRQGVAYLDLLPGTYTVVADGGLGRYGRTATTVRVTREGHPETIRLRVPRNPRLRVDASAVVGEVFLCSALHQRKVTEEAHEGAIFAPENEDLALHVTWLGRMIGVVVPVPRSGRGDALPPLKLPGAPASTVVFSVVGPGGEPARVRVVPAEGEPLGPAARFRIIEPAAWTMEFTLVPERTDLAEWWLQVDTQPGGTRDLGVIRLRRKGEPPIRVQGPDGVPVPGAWVEWTGRLASGAVELGPDGHWDDAQGAPLEGDRVEIRAPGYRLLRARLGGPGPWTFRLPGGGVRLNVRMRDGNRPSNFYGLIDGAFFEAENGRFEVRGLAAGRHTMLVAAEGAWARRYRFHLAPGTLRDFSPTLNPFP